MRLLALLVGLLLATPALAQTMWTGPYTNTTPAQVGTLVCNQPNDTTLVCTPTPALLPINVPVIQPATFTVLKPLGLGELVGRLTTSNGPLTAVAIVSGDAGNPTFNPPGFFEVWPVTQNMRITETVGAALPPAGTYSLMVMGTNAGGIGPPALITVVVPAAAPKHRAKRHK